MRLTQLTVLLSLLATSLAFAAPPKPAPSPATRWVVILNEKPVTEQYPGRIEKIRAVSEPYRQHLLQAQAALRPRIEGQHARVTGSVQHLLNAIFVVATPAQAAALRKLPGVKAVAHMRRYKKADQLSISNVAGAWSATAIGGESNAGAGVKIGIIDTGIDQTHPAFQDPSLVVPSGYPVCNVPPPDCPNLPSNCAYTTNKVIVARSYVCEIVYSDVSPTATDLASQSRPDDLTARDLDGHGTGVASVAAGVTTSYNGTQITGVAPKAFLGNYKVFGSDETNPNGSGNILQALDDAVTDGMDVVNMSLGSSAYGGPLDEGCSYSLPTGPISIVSDACDPLAWEVESAMQNAQVTVVVAAGNEGSNGYQFNYGCGEPPCYSLPTFASVGSPAYAPSAIAVGGIQNDVTYVEHIDISGSGVPSGLQTIDAFTSYDGPVPDQPTAPATLVDDGSLCTAVTSTALTGQVALVTQGSCDDVTMVTNAQSGGAVAVIEIADGESFFLPFGLSGTTIPTFIVGQDDGANLKSYVDANSGAAQASLDPRPFQVPAESLGLIPYSIAPFSSRGPVAESGALKPDLVAAATDFLIPAETIDPYGELFNFAGYGVTQGTSFATPMVTGSAALIRQANPNAATFTPLQIKSALVNTAALTNLVTSDGSAQASITEAGAGLLQTGSAVISTVQAVPATVAFGNLTTLVSATTTTSCVTVNTNPCTLTFYNTGANSVTLTLNVVPSFGHTTSSTAVEVNNSGTASLTVPAGGNTTATVSLTGNVPSPGRYEGVITASGGPVQLSIPYMFVEGDGIPYDVIPLNDVEPGQGYIAFDGAVGAQIPWYQECDNTSNSCVNDYGPIAIQVIDQYGVPVEGVPVSWAVTGGNGTIIADPDYTDSITMTNGIAGATVNLGSTVGSQEFTAIVNGSMSLPFDGYARIAPAIGTPFVVDAASFSQGKAVAPGSWIAVYGTNLSDTTQGNNGTDLAFSKCPLCSLVNQLLPMGIDGAAFSFDTANLSVPGRMNYVSPTQLNVLVPWELQGQTSATVKVIVNYTYSAEYTLPIAQFSPGFFVISYTTQAAAALDLNYNLITSSNPAKQGNAIQLYMNGLGPVSNQPADGAAALSNPLSQTPTNPIIMIGNQQANVLFSGLAPGFAGLYQVNVTVPTGLTSGMQPITCTMGTVTSTTAYLPVQ